MAPKNFLNKLWFLVEWIVTNSPSTYAAIDFLSIIEPTSKPLAVGATILVKKGKKTKHATIVAISENKKFIFSELFEMRRIAAFNLQSKSGIKRSSRLRVRETDPMRSIEDDSRSSFASPSSSVSSVASSSSFSPSSESSTDSSSNFSPSPVPKTSSGPLVSLKSSSAQLPKETLSTSSKLPLSGSSSSFEPLFSSSPLSPSLASTSRSNNPSVSRKRKLSSKSRQENQLVGTHDVSADANTSVLDIWNRSLDGASKNINKIRESLSKAQNEVDWISNSFINMNICSVDIPGVPEPTVDDNQIPKPWEKQVYPNNMVPIGKGKYLVPLSVLKRIKWHEPHHATRLLMGALFDRETMAFHSLTGKSSAAFRDDESKPQKQRLDPEKVQAIIETVSKYATGATERKIRGTITTKLADENKLWRAREEKKNGKKNNKSKEAEMV